MYFEYFSLTVLAYMCGIQVLIICWDIYVLIEKKVFSKCRIIQFHSYFFLVLYKQMDTLTFTGCIQKNLNSSVRSHNKFLKSSHGLIVTRTKAVFLGVCVRQKPEETRELTKNYICHQLL